MEEHCLFCNRGMLLWQQADQDTVGVSIGHAFSHLGSFTSSMSKAPEAKGQLRLLNLKWKGVYINDKFELKHGLARASNP